MPDLNKPVAIDLLSSGNTTALTMDKLLSEIFPGWIKWEPETLWQMMKSYTRRNVALPVRTKINAIKFLHNSEAPWKEWDDFSRVCDGILGIPIDFDVLRKPSLADVFIAVEVMNKIRQEAFSEEVAKFIAAVCLDDGILFLPKPLDFVQPLLNIVEYRCSLCGNIDILDNGICDTCGAPDSALIKVPKYFDWREVERKWNEIKDKRLDEIVLEENLIDIHLYKLLDAYAQRAEMLQQHEEEMKNVH